jgi:hypothetical protein
MLNRWFALALLPLLFAGCTTNKITNLTPKIAPRSADGLYPVEARWDSNQRSVRPDTIKAQVVVGTDFYPLQRTPLTQNRWEGVVPVPPSQRFLTYHFKFNYLYDSIPIARPDSKLSQTYQLEVTDK